MAISRSLRGDRLAAADPNWLRVISRGQRLIAMSLLGLMVSFIAVIILFVSTVLLPLNVNTPDWADYVLSVLLAIAMSAIPIALVVGAVGVFFVTTQEGREIERESAWSARNVARWSSAGAAAACAAVLMLHLAPPQWMTPLWIEAALGLAMLGLLTVAAVALLKRVATLVRRVPDDALSVRIESERKFIRWGLPFAGLYVGAIATGGGAAMAIPFFGCVGCVGFIASIGMLLSTARLSSIMRQCATHFRLCYAISLETDDRKGEPA